MIDVIVSVISATYSVRKNYYTMMFLSLNQRLSISVHSSYPLMSVYHSTYDRRIMILVGLSKTPVLIQFEYVFGLTVA